MKAILPISAKALKIDDLIFDEQSRELLKIVNIEENNGGIDDIYELTELDLYKIYVESRELPIELTANEKIPVIVNLNI